jgi:serine/threonine-protein kinase RsbW
VEAKKITYSYVASLDVLESIREMLTQAGNDIGLSKRKTYQLTLAIDEIATNVIKYGYQEAGISDGFFDLIIEFKEGELIVSLEDTATPFNPIEHSLPTEEDLNIPLEERPIGGLGVMIARQSVDEFKYEFVNNKNRNIFIVKTN